MPATLTFTQADAPQREVARTSAPARLTHVELFETTRAAETAWRALEKGGLSTPYQSFSLLDAWYRHLGHAEGGRVCILAGFGASREPLVVMPLIAQSQAGVQVLRPFGGKHVSFNMPLWQSSFAEAATPADLAMLFDTLRAHRAGDVVALTRQPLRWDDVFNPLARLPRQPSANDLPRLTIPAGAPPDIGVSVSTRKRLKKKESKLRALPGYRYLHATTALDVNRLLDMFFAIKPQRMAAAGLPNVFAENGVEAFLRSACLDGIEDGTPAIAMHALECDAEVIAVFAAVVNNTRVSTMFNTYTMSENARHSPGLILLRDMIDHYVSLGHEVIDFGIGDDDYKRVFCKDSEPIFDSFIPLTMRGRVAATALSAVTHGKRLIKSTPALKSAAQAIRARMTR